MKYTRIYNFHNIVNLRIVSSRKAYIRFFDDEYRYIPKTEFFEEGDIDILVYIDVPFPLESGSKSVQRHSLRFKNLFPVQYATIGIDQKETTVYFRGDYSVHFYPFIMCSFLLNEIIDPLLYLKFLRKNCVILHSACVSNGEKGFLFCAAGGAGKTSLALKLVRAGMIFLNDDKTIVSKAGFVYAYPRTLRLYRYNLRTLPRDTFPWTVKAAVYIKDIFRFVASRILKTRIYLATRVHLSNILPEAKRGDRFRLGKIFLLQRNAQEGLGETDYFINRLVKSCEINETLKTNFLSDRRDMIVAMETEERKIIKDIIRTADSVSTIDPQKFEKRDFAGLKQSLGLKGGSKL